MIWVRRIEEDVRVAQLACLIAMMNGGKPAWPSFEDNLAEFDKSLCEPPKQLDRDELELREVLGLRRPIG